MRQVRTTGLVAACLAGLAGCTAGPGAQTALTAQQDLVGMHRASLERCLAEVDSVRPLPIHDEEAPARTLYRADNEIGGGRDDAEGYPVLAVNTQFADDFEAFSALDTRPVRPRLRRGTWCEAHFLLEGDRVTSVDYVTAAGIDFDGARLEPCGAIVALCVSDRAQPARTPPPVPEADGTVVQSTTPPSDVPLDPRARSMLAVEHGLSLTDAQ